MTTKTSAQLTLRDRLSRLGFQQACKLLGNSGKELIHKGAGLEVDVDEHVYLGDDLFRVKFPDAVVTMTLMAEAPDRLRWNCTRCRTTCVHVGAAFSLVLEEKLALGLAAPPPERVPVESLGEAELVAQALADRLERAKTEKFRLRSADRNVPWTDYLVTSAQSGKTYRVALRGEERGDSYCSCPDFRTNTLGTCKHILYTLGRVKARFPQSVRRVPYRRKDLSLHMHYGHELSLRWGFPRKLPAELVPILGRFETKPVTDIQDLVKRVAQVERLGHAVNIYPDAEEFIQQRLFQDRIRARIAEIRKDPARHPLRKELLKVELLPYQLEGIAFCVGAGRAVLADDMGLGKTIQGVGVAELLAREAGIKRVMIICPASVKSQWKNEITRFSDRECQLVIGGAAERAAQYGNDVFYTVCNYEQVVRDILAIERVKWDLIILDEGQRIKNWEAKTSNVVKSLKSPFAVVLSGTPLENRLDDLYSVVQFIDDRRLAPAFRFFNRHRVVDEKGKVLGYRNLDQLRENLRPILLRRTRESVLQQLPPRTTDIIRIAPTEEQLVLHQAHMRVVTQITRKQYITEMDLLRLQKALLMCRMAADSTYLVDKEEPAYSSKLQHLAELLDQLFAESGRKAVLFSEWTTMLDMIEPLLQARKLDYVRLDGSVPQKQRQLLVHKFQHSPECRLFITTNAGSTGLNLQAANTVINVDLPWNPAVLEQRVGRAHRMGQQQPVHVLVLVTEQTLEEKLLTTLSNKKDLALAALDAESNVDEVDFFSGMEELKRRLEVLLGARPEAPQDESLQRREEEQVRQHRDRVAAAGGALLGAAFQFLGELVSQDDAAPSPSDQVVTDLQQRLGQCVEEDAQGQQRLTITLPNRQTLNDLAVTLAKLLAVGGGE